MRTDAIAPRPRLPARSRLRPFRTLPVLLSVALLAAGCGLLPAEEDILPPPLITPAVVQYRTQTVALGDLSSELKLVGRIQPRSHAALSFRSQSGRLLSIGANFGQTVAKGEVLAELDPGSLDVTIRIQELELRKLELVYRQLKSGGADATQLQLQDLSIQQQRIRLDELKTQRESLVLRSPIDGVVTYVASIETGDSVGAYETVLRVADPNDLLLYTNDTDASELPLGAEVALEYHDKPYEGTVLANPSTLYDDPDENLRNAAIVSFLDGLPADVKMGDSVRIFYVLDHREAVVVLPRNLIHLMGGRRYVNVLEDGVRVEKDVEVGLQTATDVEIVKGLAVGDLVILG